MRAGHSPLILSHRVAAQVRAVGDGIDGCAARKQGMGSRAPWRVDLQRAEVELGGSHLREDRPAAGISGEIDATRIDSADAGAIASACAVAHNGVLDVERAPVDAATRIRNIIGNGDKAQVNDPIVVHAAAPVSGAISGDRAVDDGYLAVGHVVDAAAIVGAIFRDRAVDDNRRIRAKVTVVTNATAILSGAISRNCAVDDGHGAAIFDAARVEGTISRDHAVGDGHDARIVDAAAPVTGAIPRDHAVDDSCPI